MQPDIRQMLLDYWEKRGINPDEQKAALIRASEIKNTTERGDSHEAA